ncbi:MAG: proton-conducting transporter membrane subunit [Ignavibacteriaceae bacterium]|nr:proton-conducting transporter membrane subunit [Ignavibacteriaceae bacterium]
MSENFLTQLSVIVLFLPLLGFVVTLLLGKKVPKIFFFEILVMFSGLVLAFVLLIGKLTSFPDARIVSEFKWIDMGSVPIIGSINIYLGVLIDDISALMIVVVYIVSFLVHFFSIDYMKDDIRYNRYFAYLGLFTFSMSGIVLTHNMLMMFMFWELVGLSSYLLIGFWFEKNLLQMLERKHLS